MRTLVQSYLIIFALLVSSFSTFAFVDKDRPVDNNPSPRTQMYNNLELALGFGVSDSVNPDRSSRIRSDGPSEEDLRRVADNFFKVQQALSFQYKMSDYISLGMYTLRSLAELGTYTVPHEDIKVLISSFETLMGEEFDPLFKETIDQIEKIFFSKRRGKFYVKIYSKNRDGIKVNIDNPGTGMVKKIEFMHIKNKARIFFSDVNSPEDEDKLSKAERKLKNFITRKVRFLFIPIGALNQIIPGMVDNIKSYLKTDRQVKPLRLEAKGMYVRVQTSSIFKTIDFKVKEAYAIPGMTDGTNPLPSFVGSARGKLLKVKVSIDQ